jgi:hypothetical protein
VVAEALPPPAPTKATAWLSRASAINRLISATMHSPPKAITTGSRPTSGITCCQIGCRSRRAVRPATIMKKNGKHLG